MSGFNIVGPVGHVFKTVDRGVTWRGIGTNLPDVPFNDIVLDPDADQTLYAGSDAGVFRTVDGGNTWVMIGTGLPHVSVTGLLLHRPSQTVPDASVRVRTCETPPLKPTLTFRYGRAKR